ncbi:MAG: hypothetical protein HY727_19995 [Candidatus Rokubacteria bacterium]|nr:hypothetical protein [Candidatus Rokubacteria bacterium]
MGSFVTNGPALGSAVHCASCGQAIGDPGGAPERFGERFCCDAHAEEFVADVRSARIREATRAVEPSHCALPPSGRRTWGDVLKRGACWGAPLLLLLALPLLWSGSAVAAAGGSLLSVLAVLACPLGMYFMMRAMAGSGHASDHRAEPAKAEAAKKDGPTSIGVALLAVALAAAAAVTPAEAREPAQGAPAFEHVHALALDARGRVLWLGAHTGLYRSEDGGRSWTKVALPVAHHEPDVMAIAIHPTEPDLVYVGTHEAGVLRSTDGGRTWRAANTGLGGLDVHGLAIDPNTPIKLHALVRDRGAGVYRTLDGGAKWVRVDDGPAGETKVLASVNIATGMGGIFLYAGTAEGLQRNPDCF